MIYGISYDAAYDMQYDFSICDVQTRPVLPVSHHKYNFVIFRIYEYDLWCYIINRDKKSITKKV